MINKPPLTPTDKTFIKDQRFNLSMMDMAKKLNSSYNRVRDFMLSSDLMLSKAQVLKIRSKKRKSLKTEKAIKVSTVKIKVSKKDKPWDWDALP